MKVINFENYNVYVDRSFENYDRFLSDYKNSKIFVVTDENVFFLHKDALEQKIKNKEIYWYVLISGDHSKTSENALNIIDFLVKNGARRNDLLVSFGGGVVTDITGFVASIYMRGINLIHIPTTIIGQIDSAIGGKTSINHEHYKNIIGSFYDPKIVICETDYLNTLQYQEILNGFGEIIKTGLIGNLDILNNLDLNIPINPNLIEMAINVKRKYVIEDYYDKSIRNTLNFGHTVGHAVEAATNFEVSHGEAVIYGMIKSLEVGIFLGKTNPKLLENLNKILTDIGYEVPKIKYNDYEKYLFMDKKSNANGVRFVFLEDILKPRIEIISWSKLKDALVNTEK